MNSSQHKHLVLVGMMGSGKSSVGRLLNHQHGIRFLDTDFEVVQRCQCSLPELFASKGEAAFRELERDVVRDAVTNEESMIISTGGGTVITPENRDLLWKNGFVVYLKAELDTLLERVSHDTNRPLLKEGDPAETLKKLLLQRASFYDQAHLTLQVDRMNPRLVASRIWSHFSKRR